MILSFGCYKGKRLSDVAKHDRGYIKWMCKYGPTPDCREAAAAFLTDAEVQRCKDEAKHFHTMVIRSAWLIHFLKEMLSKPTNDANDFTERFCRSILRRVRTEHRLDKLTYKQVRILARMWGEHYGGSEGTDEFRGAVLSFKRHMNPFWESNHSGNIPIDSKGNVRR